MTPSTTITMQAVLQHGYGTPDTWNLGQIAVPKITDKQVLVKIAAAGLDRGTWHLMTGLPYLGRLAFGIRKPKNPVPGRDLAGTIVAVPTTSGRDDHTRACVTHRARSPRVQTSPPAPVPGCSLT